MLKKTSPTLRTTGIILYLIGIAAGFILMTLTAWGDVEASMYDSAIQAEESFNTLDCPVFIGKDETRTISLEVKNTINRDVSPIVRARITQGSILMTREVREKVEIPEGDSKVFQWEITADDAAYRQLVLARIYQYSYYSLPSRQGTCGVVVVPLSGLTGQQFYILLYSVSLAFSVVGIVLFALNRTGEALVAKRKLQAVIFLAVFLLAAPLISLVTSWLEFGLLLVFAFLSLIGVLSYLLLK